MNVKETVFEAMEYVFGIAPDELEENMDTDLLSEGLIDSLGIVSLISKVSEDLDKDIEITQISFQEMKTARTLIAAIEKQVN